MSDVGDERRRALVQRHDPALRRYVERRMGARLRRDSTVDDLCQDAFARVFASFGVEDASDDEFRGRLFQHARWALADRGRKAKQFLGESVADDKDPKSPVPDRSSGTVTRRDEERWLHALVDRLDRDHADVVRRRLAGYDYRSIAEQLGVSEQAVRKRYSRVLRELRRAYGRNLSETPRE